VSTPISLTRNEYLDSVRKLDSAAVELTDGLTLTQLTWQPGNGERWSILECLDHISISHDVYLNAMETAISNANRGGNADSFRTGGFFSTKMVRDIDPPPKTKFRNPGKIAPRPTLHPETILPQFHKANERIIKVVNATAGKDLNAVRFTNPLIPLLRFTVGTGFLILTAHARRHLWQASQVRQASDFPR
jgi:hypothetical protein